MAGLSVGGATAIAGGLAAASTAGSVIAQGMLNRRNRKWQEKMYNRRLQDQRQDWQMQNEYNEELYNKYNSPAAQVQQLQAAGVNPDLNGLDTSDMTSAGSLPAAPDAGSAPYQMDIPDLFGTFGQMMSMFQNIEAQSLDNDMKRQQVKSMAKDDVLNHLVNLYNPKQDLPPIPTDVDGLGSGPNGEIERLRSSESRGSGLKYYQNLGYSKQAARIAFAMQKQFNKDDVKAAYYGKKFATAQGRKEYFESVASPLFSNDDDTMKKNFSVYAQKMYQFEMLLKEAQNAQNQFNKDFYGSRSGKREGVSTTNNLEDSATITSQNATNGETKADLNDKFNEFLTKIPPMRGFGDVLRSVFQFLWLREVK